MELDFAELLIQLLTAAKGGQYLLVAALGIAVLTRLVDALFHKIKPHWLPSGALPFVSCFLATSGMCVAAVMSGKSWDEALIVGVIGGATASGLWSLVLKYLPLIGKRER